MVFFTNRCKNRNCPLFKNSTSQPSTIIIVHWIACIKGSFLYGFFPFDSPNEFPSFLHHLWAGSPEKSQGISHRRAGFWPATKKLNHQKLEIPLLHPVPLTLCRSVITIRQGLVLCWEQRGRLSLPDPVLLVRSCLVHSRGSTCNRCWWSTAEHPHSQRVIRKLSWACWRGPVFPGPPWRLPMVIPFWMYRGDWRGPFGS